MKRELGITILCMLLAIISATAQKNYKGKNGKIKFFSAALLENIEAESKLVSSLFNELTGEVAVLIPVKSFEFKKSLMQEHFNENYMESDKYPDASFSGNIVGLKSLKETPNQVANVSGILTIHGVSKQRDLKVTLTFNADGILTAKGSLMVKLEDHKIKIPSLLFQNIAETVEVTFELLLK